MQCFLPLSPHNSRLSFAEPPFSGRGCNTACQEQDNHKFVFTSNILVIVMVLLQVHRQGILIQMSSLVPTFCFTLSILIMYPFPSSHPGHTYLSQAQAVGPATWSRLTVWHLSLPELGRDPNNSEQKPSVVKVKMFCKYIMAILLESHNSYYK